MKTHPDFGQSARSIIVLALAPAIGLGLTRFAYALILPDMRLSLDWSYAEAGFMNTANAAGYLIGALSGAMVIRRLGAFRSLLQGALACTIALLIMASTENFFLLSLARVASGLAAAYTFVGGGILAARIAQSHPGREAYLLSLFYIGPGIGFILAGAIVPSLLEEAGSGSWWIGWAALAAISAVLTLVLHLSPRTGPVPIESSRESEFRIPENASFLFGYFLYGAGISAYLTFVVAWLTVTGEPTIVQSLVWTLIGVGACIAPWIWQRALDYPRGGRGAALVICATTIGAGVPLMATNAAMLLLSAVLVGSSSFTVVAATTAYVRRNLPAQSWAAGIAVMTSAFGAGQMLGPVMAGVMTDATSTLSSGLWLSAALLAFGSLFTVLQKTPGSAVRMQAQGSHT